MKYIAMLLGLLCFGCAGSPHQLAGMNSNEIKTVTDRQLIICMQHNNYATDVVYDEAVKRSLIQEDEIDLIKTRSVKIGMSENALVASKGFGHNVNRSVGSYGVHKQYVYGRNLNNRTYVYVENGKVTSTASHKS